MKPYFESDELSLYHGDCREVLPGLNLSCDLIVTDPPYGTDWQSNRRQQRFDKIVGDDGSLDVSACLSVALKKLRRNGHVYIFGEFDFTNLPLTEKAELIWDKGMMGSGDLASAWGTSHEKIYFYTYEFSKANRDKGYGKLAARVRRGSVLSIPRLNSGAVKRHPTEKPVMLLRQLIESSSIIGDVVLDPFAGSGATLEAAVLEGRKAIGVEIEEQYCETIVKRFKGES